MSDGPRILVVEDDIDLQSVICEALTAGGYACACAPSAAEAYRAVEDGVPLAGLVVDIHLGSGGSGFDVTRQARAQRPRMPVVYITGDSRAGVEAFAVQGAKVLIKPFDPQALLAALADLGAARIPARQ